MEKIATAFIAGVLMIAGSEVFADQALLSKNGCVTCHSVDKKLVGPAFAEISKRYKGKPDAEQYLIGKIKSGGSGVWGPIPMPANSKITDQEVSSIAKWILTK